MILGAGYEMVRYADDFLVFAQSETRIQQAYQDVEAFLEQLKLIYEPTKTQLTSFQEGFRFIGVWFEGDTYEYIYRNKRIEVDDDQVDVLFSDYGPRYGD
jgi:hypothetical protein